MTNLELFLGPMFSGKTKALLQKLEDASIIYPNLKAFYILHSFNKEREILSHSKIFNSQQQTLEIIHTEKLNDIFSTIKDGGFVLCIDEAQFYPDLKEFIIKLINKNLFKNIYISGLDGDASMNEFPGSQLLKLIPLCNRVKKMHAICEECKNRAPFTKIQKGKTLPENSILIGAKNIFKPVCREHY